MTGHTSLRFGKIACMCAGFLLAVPFFAANAAADSSLAPDTAVISAAPENPAAPTPDTRIVTGKIQPDSAIIAVDSAVKTDSAITAKPKVTEPPKRREPLPEGLGDPFNYANGDFGNYVPVDNTPLTIEVLVKAIVIPNDGKAIAIIEIPEQNKIYRVKKGDAIRLKTKPQNNKPVTTETYLQIKEIREAEVEIIQQQRPDQVIIIR